MSEADSSVLHDKCLQKRYQAAKRPSAFQGGITLDTIPAVARCKFQVQHAHGELAALIVDVFPGQLTVASIWGCCFASGAFAGSACLDILSSHNMLTAVKVKDMDAKYRTSADCKVGFCTGTSGLKKLMSFKVSLAAALQLSILHKDCACAVCQHVQADHMQVLQSGLLAAVAFVHCIKLRPISESILDQ